MIPYRSKALPLWLEELGTSELSVSPDPALPGTELNYDFVLKPPPQQPIDALLKITKDGLPIGQWPIEIPSHGRSITLPSDLQPGPYEVVVTCDGWELDVVPVNVGALADLYKSDTYDAALLASERYGEALRNGNLEEAYTYAQTAVAAFSSLGSPATAARLARECASAFFSGGHLALAADVAFKAVHLYKEAKDEKGAESATHLSKRVLLAIREVERTLSTEPDKTPSHEPLPALRPHGLGTTDSGETRAPNTVNIVMMVRDIVGAMQDVVGQQIEIVSVIGPNLERMRARANGIEYVLLNLAQDAREAMPNGGRLRIETAKAQVDHNPVVRIFISHAGVDSPSGALARLSQSFPPPEAPGRGFGLFIARELIRKSGGTLSVHNEPDGASTVHIDLLSVDTEPTGVT